MARKHVGKRLIISLDIKDFFHSIKQTQLKDLFIEIGIGDAPARTLSELCTYKAYVPQGALTSPKVSNLIAAKTFGPLIKNYCDEKGYTVTIYADDVTVSMDSYTDSIPQIINDTSNFITGFGFRINQRKTKVMGYHQRQWVCGVVVNQKTNMIKKERLALRAIVHNIVKNGLEAEASKNGDITPGHFLSVVQGRLNWFKQLNPDAGQKLIDKLKVYTDTLKLENQEPADTSMGASGVDANANAPWDEVEVKQDCESQT